MLKRHKTFDLNKTRGQRKVKQLNEPKKCKYFKYFVILALIAFTLLCILMNLKLSREEHSINSLNVTIGNEYAENVTTSQINLNSTKNISFNRKLKTNTSKGTYDAVYTKMNQNIFIKNANFQEPKEYNVSVLLSPWAPAIGCIEYKDNCTLFCTDGSVSYIEENLDDLQIKCKAINLNLILENCEFTMGILRQSFFVGYFALEYLSINKCNLQTIEDPAFKHNNVKNLKTLILRNNQLTTLKATTFDGLSNLLKFEFIQAPLAVVFKGEQFLKPLTNILKEAIIQPQINGSELMDPSKWWQGLELSFLIKLDLSNTNFQDALNANTFHQLIALEYLILFNCNLFSITVETFDIISSTLKYLDLRFNHLKTLDFKFLENLIDSRDIEINLSLNEWNCDCDSEMLQYFVDHDEKLTEEMICLTPAKWEHILLADVVKKCKESKTTTVITTITDTTYIATSTTTTSIVNTILPVDSSTEPITETSTINSTTNTSSSMPTTTSKDSSTFSMEPSTNSASSMPTTPTPPLIPPNLMSINCTINKNTERISRDIVKPNAIFFITNTSSSSLTISVQTTANLQNFSIIYFTSYNDYKDAFESKNSKSQSRTVVVNVYIKDIKTSTAYVFCFVMESALRVSPFDCKAHFMGEFLHEKTTWLLKTDQVWFFAVSIIVAVLLFFISIFIVYILLRYNPSWLLYRNERILQVHNNSRDVLVLSRKLSMGSLRSSNYLKYLQPATNKETNDSENTLYSTRLTIPIVNAPIIPTSLPRVEIARKYHKSSSSPASRCRNVQKVTTENMHYLDLIANDPEYQTIDHYEAIDL